MENCTDRHLVCRIKKSRVKSHRRHSVNKRTLQNNWLPILLLVSIVALGTAAFWYISRSLSPVEPSHAELYPVSAPASNNQDFNPAPPHNPPPRHSPTP